MLLKLKLKLLNYLLQNIGITTLEDISIGTCVVSKIPTPGDKAFNSIGVVISPPVKINGNVLYYIMPDNVKVKNSVYLNVIHPTVGKITEEEQYQ